jgi:Ca2+/Na+ antiporter
MATRRGYSKSALAAIVGGVVLTAIEVIGAVGYLLSQDQPSYLVAGGAVVTVVAAILPILARRCWQGGRYLLAASCGRQWCQR